MPWRRGSKSRTICTSSHLLAAVQREVDHGRDRIGIEAPVEIRALSSADCGRIGLGLSVDGHCMRGGSGVKPIGIVAARAADDRAGPLLLDLTRR